jgi:DNA modification methylase
MNPYYESNLGKLYHGNAVDIIPDLPQVDLIVTSPPYDNLRTYEGYDFDFEKMAHGMKVITKDGGVVVWVVGDATVNGSETGTSFKQALHFKEIGFNLHDTMIYQKENPIPLTHNRYEQYFEYMFVLSTGRPKTFNPIIKKCAYFGKKKHRQNTARTKEAATRNRDEITKAKENKYVGNIFKYVCGNKKHETGTHPAPFPQQLAQDHIISWSNEGDTVFDPMCGSGTVPKMAERLNRKWLACEISEKYCEIIAKRVESEASQLKLFI